MKTYIGTKVINATPMNRQEYNDFKGWKLPENENGSDEGHLVEYIDGEKANIPQYAGYVTWSPKEVFEKTYYEKLGNGLPFGIALEEVKRGKGMRLPSWKPDVVIRLWKPGRIEQLSNRLSLELPNSYVDDTLAAVNLLNLDEMTAPFLYVSSRFGMVPWKETMIELLSNDWEVVD